MGGGGRVQSYGEVARGEYTDFSGRRAGCVC